MSGSLTKGGSVNEVGVFLPARRKWVNIGSGDPDVMQGATSMSAIIRPVVILTLSAATVAGCGQTGPLFLPGDPSTIRAPAAEPGPAAERGEDEDDETPPDGA